MQLDGWGGETYRLRPRGMMGKHGAAGAGKRGVGRAAGEEADEAPAARSPEGFAKRISSLEQGSVHIRFSLSQKHCLAAVGRWDEGMQGETCTLGPCCSGVGRTGGGLGLALSQREGEGEVEARCLAGRCDLPGMGGRGWQRRRGILNDTQAS